MGIKEWWDKWKVGDRVESAPARVVQEPVLSEVEERLYDATVKATTLGQINWKQESSIGNQYPYGHSWYHGGIFIEGDKSDDDKSDDDDNSTWVFVYLRPGHDESTLKVDDEQFKLDSLRLTNLIELIETFIANRKAETLEKFLSSLEET